MAIEKQSLFDSECGAELPQPSLYSRRRRTIFALSGLALLATGFAAGAGMSLFCDNGLTDTMQALVSPINPGSPGSPDSPFHNLFKKDFSNTSTDASTNVLTKPAKKPNKLYGPKTSSAEVVNREVNVQDSETTEKQSEDKPFYSRIQQREKIEKRDVWQPAVGTTWTYQLNAPPSALQLRNAGRYDVWDIDLFDTPISTIEAIHTAGSKVICYFSAGTFENWRLDINSFKTADIGISMGDWPGENWVNVKSRSLRAVMAARLDLAKSKGCDGVDPDNMDGYNHDTGFGLTQTDAVNYVNYLSQQASARGLAIGLKNSGEIIPRVINAVQYSVEEACNAYSECGIYAPFTAANKPVFHVEYPKGYGVVNTVPASKSTMSQICACIPSYGLSPIVKNNNLDTWQQECK